MPCCGLNEYRDKVALKYTLSGGAVFWCGFAVVLIIGALLAWIPSGRMILRVQWNFLCALWDETMRQRDSVPARWSCRLSGRLLNAWPRLAAIVYRHPEVPLVYAPVVGLVGLVGAALWALHRL